MSTLVYRIQDNEGRGPWRPGFSKHWVESRPDQERKATVAIICESEALKLAREAGGTVSGSDYFESVTFSPESLVKFADLVAKTDSFNRLPKHERDALLR